MEFTFKATKVTVVVSPTSTDTIYITLDAPTTFPEMGYKPFFKIEARKGYGVQWCMENLGVEPEVQEINT